VWTLQLPRIRLSYGFVNQVIKEAIDLRATDVHFEPFENELRVRYRVDGILQNAIVPSESGSFRRQ